ncbi:NAD(P)/FAD-dependent oxidoreductase [Lutibaculum baratangense]|uniref:Thioredoxin reductase n=1 Tax=Lutibaculum baratangense AMV1 TaxID=631454 RepID=V4RK49_9HYPH|nr:NAD(P)/FAD-dependent oxidoreductase [Lutibaculum baratangense]ESR25709.1 Thioredoxin reductase [Lutibaculum baratangense AMV1]
MTSDQDADPFDCAVVGAGPAGASCAVWLARLGLRPVLLEADARPGGATAKSPYRNDWLATSPGATGEDLARQIARSLELSGVDLRCGARVASVGRERDVFLLSVDGQAVPIAARTVVLAGGCSPVADGFPDDPRILVGPGAQIFHHEFAGLDVAVLGGGDNGFENAAFVLEKGARRVDLYARSVRARPDFVAAVPAGSVTAGPYEVGADGLAVNGRRYDRVLVMYGFRPDLGILATPPDTDARGHPVTARDTAETSASGVYAIGEIAGRAHPCVATALGEGVVAAKAIERRLRP